MFFKDYFLSLADVLDARFIGHQRAGQNPADIGELCEWFIKEFLDEALSSNLKIIRGGKIVNIQGKESNQLDVLACAKNTISIFSHKGIYPVETVGGVFSVTSTLSFPKLEKCIKEFASIPKDQPKLIFPG